MFPSCSPPTLTSAKSGTSPTFSSEMHEIIKDVGLTAACLLTHFDQRKQGRGEGIRRRCSASRTCLDTLHIHIHIQPKVPANYLSLCQTIYHLMISWRQVTLLILFSNNSLVCSLNEFILVSLRFASFQI